MKQLSLMYVNSFAAGVATYRTHRRWWLQHPPMQQGHHDIQVTQAVTKQCLCYHACFLKSAHALHLSHANGLDVDLVELQAQRANVTYEDVARRGKGKGNHHNNTKLMQSPSKKRPASAASAKTPSPAQPVPLDADMVRLDIAPL